MKVLIFEDEPKTGDYLQRGLSEEGWTAECARTGAEGLYRAQPDCSTSSVATELFFEGRAQSLIDRLIADTPLGRLGEPRDIARVVSFLADAESGWINGQIVRANGGRN